MDALSPNCSQLACMAKVFQQCIEQQGPLCPSISKVETVTDHIADAYTSAGRTVTNPPKRVMLSGFVPALSTLRPHCMCRRPNSQTHAERRVYLFDYL